MPGTIHQCQGQEATAVGVCAALKTGRLHHLDLPWPRARPRQGVDRAGAARRAVRRRHRLLQGQGRIDARGRHEQGHGARHRDRRRWHSAGGRHGAGVQDAEDRPGRRVFLWRRCRREGRLPRRRQHGRDLGPARHLRLREQSLRRLDPHRPRDEESTASPIERPPTDSRARPSTATTCGPSTRPPRAAAARCREGGGPVLLELLTYRRTGHSRRDALPYQPEEERKAGSRATRSNDFGRPLWSVRASSTKLDVERVRAQAAQAQFR